jgi:hypothetical protein
LFVFKFFNPIFVLHVIYFHCFTTSITILPNVHGGVFWMKHMGTQIKNCSFIDLGTFITYLKHFHTCFNVRIIFNEFCDFLVKFAFVLHRVEFVFA